MCISIWWGHFRVSVYMRDSTMYVYSILSACSFVHYISSVVVFVVVVYFSFLFFSFFAVIRHLFWLHFAYWNANCAFSANRIIFISGLFRARQWGTYSETDSQTGYTIYIYIVYLCVQCAMFNVLIHLYRHMKNRTMTWFIQMKRKIDGWMGNSLLRSNTTCLRQWRMMNKNEIVGKVWLGTRGRFRSLYSWKRIRCQHFPERTLFGFCCLNSCYVLSGGEDIFPS